MSSRNRPSGKISPGLAGTAGEYLVAGELSRRGYIASITIRNARGIDILASDENARRSVGIQVKTSQGSKPRWILNQKVETMDTAENLYFVLVVLNGLAEPAYHIVPRKKLIREVTTRHREWLSAPGRKGQQRKDSTVRKFEDVESRYRDRWDYLGLD